VSVEGGFLAVLAAVLAGAAASLLWPSVGSQLWGLSLLGLVGWLAASDVARPVHYYLAAGIALLAGIPAGAWMLLLDDGHRPRLLLFHAHINLLGFVTLTVLGTLLTLWPTVLRTRIADTAPRAATRALPPSLIGDDGTFSVPNKIILAKGVPTVVSVTALSSSQGMHGAVLTIDDLQTKVVDGWAMLAVQTAAPLVPGGTWSASGTVQRNGTVVYAVAVPAGATSLTVNLSGLADGSQTRWWAFTPDGVRAEAVAAGTAYCYANYLDGNGCSPTSRTYTAPKAGVWELVVESRRTSPLLTNPYQLAATITR